MRSVFAALRVALLLAALPAGAASAKTIPAPPPYYVLDEPHVLDAGSLRALERLLTEHDRVTGEQVVAAIFNSLDNEDPVAFTNQVFTNWKIGRRGKDNGVLLALYWKEHKARIEVGYGMESLLTDAKTKDLIADYLVPDLKAGHPGRAMGQTLLQLLTVLESPLVQSGEALRILRGAGSGNRGARIRVGPVSASAPWPIIILLGGALLFIVLNLLTSADAHFTRAGWFRPRPWQRRGFGGGIFPMGGGGFGGGGFGGGGGGFGGGGGGGGGFSGGGGSSGGGGASGEW